MRLNKKVIIPVITIGLLAIIVVVVNPFSYANKKSDDTLNLGSNIEGFTVGSVDTDKTAKQQVAEAETVPTDSPASDINTKIEEVIESDEETGAVTGVNSDGDVVVTNDKALEVAEKNAEEEKELQSIVDDALEGVIKPIESSDSKSADTKEVTPTKKPEKEQPKSDKATNDKFKAEDDTKNDAVEIDEETKNLFDEMGWGEPTTDHSQGGIPEDAEWTIDHPDRNYNGTFSTP